MAIISAQSLRKSLKSHTKTNCKLPHKCLFSVLASVASMVYKIKIKHFIMVKPFPFPLVWWLVFWSEWGREKKRKWMDKQKKTPA